MHVQALLSQWQRFQVIFYYISGPKYYEWLVFSHFHEIKNIAMYLYAHLLV